MEAADRETECQGCCLIFLAKAQKLPHKACSLQAKVTVLSLIHSEELCHLNNVQS